MLVPTIIRSGSASNTPSLPDKLLHLGDRRMM
jgi:hypothetical protein